MNRLNRCLSGAFAALLIAAAPALCANLLLDDFTDPVASLIDNWIKSNVSSDVTTATVNGGSLAIDNPSGQYLGEYIHSFGANKPATFTLSYILKSIQGNLAGALFCRQPGDNPSGYLLTTEGETVFVYKVAVGNSGIRAEPIFYKNSFDMKPTDNELTVSKNGSSFNVFVNGEFQGSFTDASYNTGDLSLLLFNNTKIVLGKLQVTDEFKSGGARTSFSDNFNGNNLKYWRQDITSASGPKPSVNESDGKLKMVTGADAAAYIYVDINLTDFDAKVEATHLSGKLDSPYGLLLVGNGSSQMVKFFILGNGSYATWKSGDARYNPVSNTKIRGGRGHQLGIELTDTITLRKKKDSPNYEFLVNGEPLAIDLGPVNFPIKGIGLFSESEMTVAFDNFNVKQNTTVSIIKDNKKQISRNPSSLVTRSHAFYDMRGRQRYTTTSTQGRVQTKAAGIYVNKNGRDVATRKSRVANE